MDANLHRRDLFKLFTAAALANGIRLEGAISDKPLFFSADEFALLDKLTDLIIPTDSHSPGAHDAGVAAFIDRTVAEAFLPEDKETWRKGLAAIDQLAHDSTAKPFVEATNKQQIALLKALAEREEKPETEAEKFFSQVKMTTAFAYYSSKIGIHTEMEYKGNVILDQFVGYEPT